MDGLKKNGDPRSEPSKLREMGLWLLGIVVVLVIGFTLEDEVGIPVATTLRIATAAICLLFIYKIGLGSVDKRLQPEA